MSYQEAIQYLYGLQVFGSTFGLDNTLRLAACAGHPQERLKFIHVAGTNGKGSTCAMLESIFRHAGFRVGLYTSPHLISFSERIQINRVPVSEQSVAELTNRLRGWIAAGWKPSALGEPTPSHPTFFEVVTMMALVYFAEQNCDLVIWETGMGGRLDATNIVTPLASVVTNVQWDHQQWLGSTLREIALEKAGIIKPGVPVFTSCLSGEGLEEMEAVARERGAPLRHVTPADLENFGFVAMRSPLLGAHQRINAALAAAVTYGLNDQLPVSRAAIFEGLKSVSWPGRFEVFARANRGTIVVDGAHNPAGAKALRETIQACYPQRKCCILFGVLADKDWRAIIRELAPLAHRILLLPVRSERSERPDSLRPVWKENNEMCDVQFASGIEEALALTSDEPLTIITGSLYLAGEALRILCPRTGNPESLDESGLNDWGPAVKR